MFVNIFLFDVAASFGNEHSQFKLMVDSVHFGNREMQFGRLVDK
jgi:hypothetical protein